MRKRSFTTIILILAAVLCLVSSCGNEGVHLPEVLRVDFHLDFPEIAEGKTVQLKATAYPAYLSDTPITWSSSNTNVARVDANGLLTAVATGEAVITAEAGGKTASCTVIVRTPLTIKFKGNGGTGDMEDQAVLKDIKTTINPNTFEKTGYTFKEWNTKIDGSGDSYKDKGEITLKDNMTLYAQWRPNTYSVAFNNNGGTGTMENQSFTYDVAQDLSKNTFTKEGYPFIKWNTQPDASGTSFIDEQEVINLTDKDGDVVTLYARWVEAYEITFFANDGTGDSKKQFVDAGDTENLEPNPFERAGYSFVEWNTMADGSGTKYADGQEVTPPSNMELYAQWVTNTYTVSFDANGGSAASPSSITVTYGANYGELATTSRDNFTFKGWFTELSGGTQITPDTEVTIASNHTLHAQWTGKEINVTFDPNGGTVSPNSKKVNYNSTYGDLPTPARDGYSFSGWFTSASGGSMVTSGSTVTVLEDQTLYAHWSVKKCTVKFMMNDETTDVHDIKTETYDANYVLPETNPSRLGYTFEGWFTEAVDGTKVTTSTKVKNGEDHNVYAHWKVLPPLTVKTTVDENYVSLIVGTSPKGTTTYKVYDSNGVLKEEGVCGEGGKAVYLEHAGYYVEIYRTLEGVSFLRIEPTDGKLCYVYGNVMSLVYGDKYNTDEDRLLIPYQSAFYNLFSEADIDIDPDEELILPATTLTASCYEKMFYHCSYLSKAPELPAKVMATDCYSQMFEACTNLTTAPDLPAKTLAESCYAAMFSGCTNLETAPALPATTLYKECYSTMFNRCTKLEIAPELPATTVKAECYLAMFENCYNLTTVPELPATTMESKCYKRMFNGCYKLTTVPALPATTLAEECYANMFEDCTGITAAPDLPAETLKSGCYKEMFSGCEKLVSIKCLATDISASGCTTDWVYHVPSTTGTFTKASSMTGWTTGANGIPTGWTVNNQ